MIMRNTLRQLGYIIGMILCLAVTHLATISENLSDQGMIFILSATSLFMIVFIVCYMIEDNKRAN